MILIVEDDLQIRELMAKGLELGGYKTETASNGQEALEMLSRIPRPCLILLDLMMPVMNGWQFMEKFQTIESLKQIPVIAVSAIDNAQSAPQHVQKFLKKPISFSDLYSAIAQYCQRDA